jgi:WD40 repeat protein
VLLATGACGYTEPTVIERPGGLLMSIAFAPDGQALTTASSSVNTGAYSGSEDFISTSMATVASLRKVGDTWTEGDTFNSPGPSDIIQSIAYSGDGRYLAAGQWSGSVSIWDTAKPQSPPTVMKDVCGEFGSDVVNVVAFNPSNNDLAVGCLNGSLVLLNIDQPTASPTVLVKNNDTDVDLLAFSSDGTILAVDSPYDVVSLWNTDDLERAPRVLRLAGGPPSSLAFSPTSHLLAASGYDGAIWLWDTSQLYPVPTPVVTGTGSTDVRSDVNTICFTSDDKLIAAGYHDQQLQLWDAHQSNVLVRKFTDFVSAVRVACSPTEPLVATADHDFVRQFNIDPKD